MITKKELLTGAIRFVKNEVIPHVSDKSLQIVMTAALYAIDAKPDIVNAFFNNPIVSSILQSEDGKYDVETLFNILDKVTADCGGIPITIPPIKFVTSTETTLTFYANDVRKLKEYVTKEEANA